MSDFRLQRRRHPDGFALYDVFVRGKRVGMVRQKAVEAPSWFAYLGLVDEPIGRWRTRKEAIAALLEALEGT